MEPITTWQKIKIIGEETRSETQWGKNKISLKQEAANQNLQKKKAVVLSGDSITQRKKRNIPVTVEECISSEKKYILDRVRGRQPKLYIYIICILYPVCQVGCVKGRGAI